MDFDMERNKAKKTADELEDALRTLKKQKAELEEKVTVTTVRNFIALVDSSGNSRIVLQFWRCKIIGILPIYPPSPHPFQCWRPATRYQIFVGPMGFTLNRTRLFGIVVIFARSRWYERQTLCYFKMHFCEVWNLVISICPLKSHQKCLFFSFLVFSFSYIDTNYSFGRAISTLNLFLN